MIFVDSAEDFVKWATSAKRGHRVCYYRGWLMRDKMRMMPQIVKDGAMPHEFWTANKAWEFAEMGVVALFQKRQGEEDYLYLAVKT